MLKLFYSLLVSLGAAISSLSLFIFLPLGAIFLPFIAIPVGLYYAIVQEKTRHQSVQAENAQNTQKTEEPVPFKMNDANFVADWDESEDGYRDWPTKTQTAKVLIVDDDPEAANLVQHIFQKAGYSTMVTGNVKDAKKRMLFEDIDIIILDWNLGVNESGGQVLSETARQMRNRSMFGKEFQTKPPRIVTYSSMDLSEIDVPQSEFYIHIDHWNKTSMSYSEMGTRTAELMEKRVF